MSSKLPGKLLGKGVDALRSTGTALKIAVPAGMVGLSIPFFSSMVLNVADKTHGIRDFSDEIRLRRRLDTQTDLLKKLVDNTSGIKGIDSDQNIIAVPKSKNQTQPQFKKIQRPIV